MATFEEVNSAYGNADVKSRRDIGKEREHENGSLQEELAKSILLLKASNSYIVLIVSDSEVHEIIHNPNIALPARFENHAAQMLARLLTAKRDKAVSKEQEAVK